MTVRWRSLVALGLALVLVASFLVGCGGGEETTDTTTEKKTDVKAAMVTDTAGLGDKSFNDLAWAGLEQARDDLGVEVKVLESKEQTDYEPNLTQLATAGYNPVFAIGFLMQDTVSKVSTAYPDVNFGVVDVFFDPTIDNVVGLNFKEQEAAYLAGVVAGMLTTMTDVDPRINDKKVVGFVGGMEIPPVQRFFTGFKAGVESIDPGIEVKYIYTGNFGDQQKGKEAGLSLIEAGSDIVFAAAGACGIGTFAACQEKDALFIGVDADQYLTLTNPGDTIITSAIKKVDKAVYDTVKKAVDGNFKGGMNELFGLKEEGVGLAPYHEWDSKLPQSVKDAVDQAEQDVIDGTVTVPSE